MKQETRQWVWAALCYGMWGVATILTYLRVNGTLEQEWGATIILTMGVAIAAAIRLSRMRLTDTMIDVYRAGVETARVQHIEREDMERRIMEAAARYDARHAEEEGEGA